MNHQDHPIAEHLPALLTGAMLAVVITFALVIVVAFLWFTVAIFWSAIS